jgi:hypothetical protein
MHATAESNVPVRNRKGFVRTKIPLAESIAAAACILLLVVIGVTIYLKGKHFDPALYAVRIEAKTATVGVSVAEARPAAAGAGYETAAAVATAAKGEPLDIKLDGLQPMGDTEFYNADNLYEKIDGRAPAYLNFNFQQLRCRPFSVPGVAGSFVDVYEYRFDTPVNAFGMFALERDPKGGPLAFAPDGYAGELGFYFRQGAVYVQVIASDQNAKTVALAKAIAENRAQNLPADDAGLASRRCLPATGLDPASVQYVANNALGQDFLTNVFQAVYDLGGAKLPFFVMMATPGEAAAAWTSLREFSGKFGGRVTPLPDVNGAKVFQAEGFGTWKIIYQRGSEIGGVFDANDRDKALQFVEQYLQGKIQ